MSEKYHPQSPWNDFAVEMLKQMWAEKWSASQIAAAIGFVTRNSVIGKARRLGLGRHPRLPARMAPAPSAKTAHKHNGNPWGWRGKQAKHTKSLPMAAETMEAIMEPQIVAGEIPLEQRCSILELTNTTCRWPIGQPGTEDFFFCGGKAIPGLPYCLCHCRMAYRQPESRRGKAA